MSVPYALFAATAGSSIPGPQGPPGATGATGPIGPQGPQGANGLNGVSITSSSIVGDSLFLILSNGQTLNAGYVRGPQGPIGLTGAIGSTGPQGPIGPTGPQGPQGLAGATGSPGPQGPIGLTGPQGPQGLTGATGSPGPQGPTGLTGATGPQGQIGQAGTPGINGVSIVNSSIINDSLFLNLSNGQILNTGNVRGPQGPAGAQGAGGFSHFIGEEFGGGIIFFLWRDAQSNEHGLVVDKTDLSNSQAFSNLDTTTIGTSAQSTWDGLNNSLAIVSQPGHLNSAAELCLNSINGGQSDWYLPSATELNLLWQNYFIIAKMLSQIPGATEMSSFFWSSSEVIGCGGCAYVIDFKKYEHYPYFGKGHPNNVRAIRSF